MCWVCGVYNACYRCISTCQVPVCVFMHARGVCVCVCVCERERAQTRNRIILQGLWFNFSQNLSQQQLVLAKLLVSKTKLLINRSELVKFHK